MNNLLVISCSPQGAKSPGDQLAKEMIEGLRRVHSGLTVSTLDLVDSPVSPISGAYAQAIITGVSADDPVFAESERLITQLERCDALVITTPVHNFTLPAALKLWVDNVVRARRTFSVGPRGKVGLLRDRPVYVVVSSGGVHRGPGASQPEFLSSYLRHVLGCIGLLDVHFIYLQAMAAGPQYVSASIADGKRQFNETPLFSNLEALLNE
ncbi:FMN-dependent NADH-azoreductase [Pseudomonas koreensis]|uniref:FMN-dependent NADH-azoreductase n=1 Tax=Pseudomonas koreensis TaxID=198620 RepID=UPI00285E234F|nr:NAD(P)H-dependent oxidoreductase [Pseudomonas koreensis]MDR7052928.1 FMN-dependent NADH-azoreductase [Pseudomonas koreensis]